MPALRPASPVWLPSLEMRRVAAVGYPLCPTLVDGRAFSGVGAAVASRRNDIFESGQVIFGQDQIGLASRATVRIRCRATSIGPQCGCAPRSEWWGNEHHLSRLNVIPAADLWELGVPKGRGSHLHTSLLNC